MLFEDPSELQLKKSYLTSMFITYLYSISYYDSGFYKFCNPNS